MMQGLTKQQQEVRQEVEKQVEKQIEKRVKKRLSDAVREKSSLVQREFKTQAAGAIIAAFGFLIALVWKDLIVKLMENLTPPTLIAKYPYLAQLYSAILVTFIAVIGIMLISRWVKSPDKTPNEQQTMLNLSSIANKINRV